MNVYQTHRTLTCIDLIKYIYCGKVKLTAPFITKTHHRPHKRNPRSIPSSPRTDLHEKSSLAPYISHRRRLYTLTQPRALIRVSSKRARGTKAKIKHIRRMRIYKIYAHSYHAPIRRAFETSWHVCVCVCVSTSARRALLNRGVSPFFFNFHDACRARI